MKNKLLKLFITLLSIFLISNTVYAEDENNSGTGSGDNVANYITITTVAGDGSTKAKKYYIGMYMDDGDLMTHSTNKFLYKYNENDESDYPAYCIQGGAPTPDSNSTYKLNTTVDINLCKKNNSGASKDDGGNIVYDLYGACGMAELLYQINNKNSELYKTLGKKYYGILHNEDYGFAIITTALRLWINYYNNQYLTSKLSNIGVSAGKVGNTYNNDKAYMLNTNENKEILDELPACGSDGCGGSVTNGFCYCKREYLYDDKLIKNYDKNNEGAVNLAQLAYSLFHYLYENRNNYVSFKSNAVVSGSNKITYTSSVTESNKTYTMKVKDNETDEKKVYDLLASCAKTEKGCSSIMTVKDQYGNEIGSCKAPSDGNICYNIKLPNTGKDNSPISIEIMNVKKCNIVSQDRSVKITAETTTTKTDAQTINKYWFGIYNHNSSNNMQALVTFNKDQINISDPIPTTTAESLTLDFPFINIECPDTCDPTHQCDTLEPTTDIPKDSNDSNKLKTTCDASATSDAGFEVKSIEDPSMSCIINNCEDTSEYQVSLDSIDSDICKLYCREEIKFYLPTKVYVNAGMQFAYDIGDSLKRYGIIKEQIDESKKLTSVVVRYNQCTAVFNQSAYNKSTSPQKEELKKQCLFADKEHIIKNKILNTINSDDIKLEVEYDENTKNNLKNNLEIGSVSRSTVDSITYCKDNCYEVANGKCSVNESNFSSTRPEIKDDSVIYSTMIIKTESDYYLKTKFKYEPISGKTSISTGSGDELLIPEYSYPVSINTETKLEDSKKDSKGDNTNISFTFSGKSIEEYDSFKYNCWYFVYNTIMNNNCKNSSDLSQCSNKCFVVDKDGYSHLDPNCITWNTSSKVKFGLNYRNVSLENMFPVTRTGRNNWYVNNIVANPFAKSKDGLAIDGAESTITVGDLITTTQTNGNNIYNDKHLEGKYVLTPETIKNIREYNKENSNNYLNNIKTYNNSDGKATFFNKFFSSEGGN